MVIKGDLVNNRVLIWDLSSAKTLYKMGFFGKYVGVRKARELETDRPLEVSLVEACYLVEQGILKVEADGKVLSLEELLKISRGAYENFDEVYRVYKDLKSRGYVVKSGIRFGTTFAVYEHGPGIDHAPFLVHVLPFSEKLDPLEIIRAGRLSHSVKKRFVLATVDREKGEVHYFVFKWFG